MKARPAGCSDLDMTLESLMASIDQGPATDKDSATKTILVVDDEEPILEAVAYGLRKEGFRVRVAVNAEAGLRIFKEARPDLVILDVMLPSASGFEVCKEIRGNSKTPVILLTAMVEERHRVQGLELGADDYVTKPFSVRELVARVRAILRRTPDAEPVHELTVGDLTVNPSTHEARLGGKLLHLSKKEFALLAFLAQSPGIVFTRQTLLDRVWGEDAFVEDRTVDVHVSWLRSKLEQNPSRPEWILTVRGVGYKLADKS